MIEHMTTQPKKNVKKNLKSELQETFDQLILAIGVAMKREMVI
jgi:hypothetical protein